VKVVLLLALASAAINAGPFPDAQMPYRAAAAAAQEQAPALVEWAKEAIAPLFERNFKALIETCAKSASETEPNSVRVVVILSGGSTSVSIDPEGSVQISECAAQELKKWNWPAPPKSVAYVPIELNTHPPDPAEAEQAAEQFMRDVAPSNTSLERTRDR